MSKKILMVDDEPEFIFANAEALEDEGFEVIITSDLDHAIHLLETQKFDLIIMDLLMPPKREEREQIIQDLRQTGIKLHREVRLKLKLRTPIIVMSAVRDENVLRQLNLTETSTSNNTLQHLKKPAFPPDLIRLVKQALR